MLLKAASEKAAAGQLNAAGAKRACWIAGHVVYSRHKPATPGADEAD